MRISETLRAVRGSGLEDRKGCESKFFGNQEEIKEDHHKVTFHMPKTLKKDRNPKYPGISATPRNKLDHYQILKYPLTTESAMKKMQFQLLLIEDIIPFNDQLNEMLAREGSQISIKLSDIYSPLENVCLEGK
ncbi:unnamed protein product [Fraxinus pennsylvanica]|uniref:Large ribosomal subunit protein uL23 N-terminal domain-containing protein n=1 Tax=Fraxinus pennsylvanica TaxID=56036 RepID=A0AAD2ECR4_9LAMI|nr:unnamed protein product [Fraxinus pennsylvanica]